MEAFGKTQFGKQILADFTPKGETIFGVAGNGKYAQYNIRLHEFDYTRPGEQASKLFNGVEFIEATTGMSIIDGKPNFYIIFDAQRTQEDLMETIVHEFSLHLGDYATFIDTYEKNKSISTINRLWDSQIQDDQHHDLLRPTNLQKYQGTNIYFKTSIEMMKMFPASKETFLKEWEHYFNSY